MYRQQRSMDSDSTKVGMKTTDIDIRKPPIRVVHTPSYLGVREWCIAGTGYGYYHTTSGTIRTWKTYSGAHKWLKKVYEL
jgi:hypothetical protein